MKKLYYAIITIGILVFLYWIISSLPSVTTKFFTVTQDSLNKSKFSSTSSFGFKSTAERQNLIIPMLEINTQFINSPPILSPEIEDDIKYFYKIEPYFPSFKNYYIAKLKVKNVLKNELPNLLKETHSLSQKEVENYFNNNSKYIQEKLGITNSYDFYEFILTIESLNGKEIAEYELTESFFTIPSQGITSFRIMLKTTDDKYVYLPINAEIYNSTDYQTAPVIKFLGTAFGGIS